jgi:hypothetical protein
MPFFSTCILGVSPADGAGVTVLVEVPPPCVLVTFAAKFCASFLPNLLA